MEHLLDIYFGYVQNRCVTEHPVCWQVAYCIDFLLNHGNVYTFINRIIQSDSYVYV